MTVQKFVIPPIIRTIELFGVKLELNVAFINLGLLMQLQQAAERNDLMEGVKINASILRSCIISPKDINIEDIPVTELPSVIQKIIALVNADGSDGEKI